MASAIVGSRLDYCNSLFAGTSVSNLARLQLVQNTFARIVAQKSRFDHITPVLSELHWLPVRHRINFKIAALTHRVLQSQQPSYLTALIPHYAPVRSLCSSSSLSICVSLRKTSMATSRSLSSVAPKMWNSMSGHLSSIPTLPAFRRALKHHFFLCAYPDNRTSGGITLPERMTLCDTTTPAAITPLEREAITIESMSCNWIDFISMALCDTLSWYDLTRFGATVRVSKQETMMFCKGSTKSRKNWKGWNMIWIAFQIFVVIDENDFEVAHKLTP